MNKKNRIRAAITLAIGTALLFPVASSAQVGTLLREAGEVLDRQAATSLPRYRRVGALRTGALATGDKVDQRFALRAGQQYGFLAVGDEDALDVDLQLLDSRGRPVRVNGRVVEDRTTDEVAVVRFTPRKAGRYVVRTIMFDCQVATCEYALGTYRR